MVTKQDTFALGIDPVTNQRSNHKIFNWFSNSPYKMLDIHDIFSQHKVWFSLYFDNAECSEFQIHWLIPRKIFKLESYTSSTTWVF